MKPCRWPLLAAIVLLGPCGGVRSAGAAELVLSDFNGAGFDYTFGGFDQVLSPNSVRLTDPDDNAGGAGIGLGGIDLSTLADGRLVIDFTPLPTNTAARFDIELIDSSGSGPSQRSGKWSFNVAGLTPGTPTQLVSTNTLSSPTFGIGDFENLDLSDVAAWQVLGDYTGQSAFDFEFDRVAISTDVPPPPPYRGAEPDAPWRATAASRIDAIRKADLAVSVVDLAGNPVPGARVQVNMREHEFGFGSAVQAFRLESPSSQHNTYKNFTQLLFNVATLENSLKWQGWEGEFGGLFDKPTALAALDWLADAGVEARGHVMIWPGVANLPDDIQQMLADGDLTPSEQTAVRTRIANHFADLAASTNGRLTAWDVVNETRTNNDLMRELSEGDGAIADWFRLADTLAGQTDLYLNDFGILNSWSSAPANRDQYYATIQTLLADGAPIEGIGFQGHFVDGDITGPEQLWAIVDRFAELDLAMQVTEFDFTTSDEQLQAAYTADFLTAMFAHEGIDDVILWGFWEDAHWRPDAALFRSDWSIKPNGQAYLDLVFEEWWTDETLVADADGAVSLRGFKGDYRVTAIAAGENSTSTMTLSEGGAGLTVTLSTLAGDYNGNGVVDAADYTVWRDALGAEVTPGFGADGNNDGVIDDDDYALWLAYFGATSGASATAPEPSGAVLVACLVAALRKGRDPRSVRLQRLADRGAAEAGMP